MKFGTFLRLLKIENAQNAFANLKKNSFSCCHLVYKPDVYTEEDARIVKAAADENGIEISALFAGYKDDFTKWNLYSDFEDAGINSAKYGKERIEYLKQAAVFAKNVGTENVLIHAGFVANNPFSEEYTVMVELVKEVAEYLKALGLNLLLESGGESPIVLKRLIEDVGTGNVFSNLDTANLIMYGLGNPVDAAYTLGDLIKSVHIKDGMPPVKPRELGRETEFMQGFVDFPRVFSVLKDNHFDGPYIIEREISDESAAQKIAETLEQLKKMLSA